MMPSFGANRGGGVASLPRGVAGLPDERTTSFNATTQSDGGGEGSGGDAEGNGGGGGGPPEAAAAASNSVVARPAAPPSLRRYTHAEMAKGDCRNPRAT